jgi:succinoglycan biosynthesis protein ExoU
VVSDGSSDATAEVARNSAGGDTRLHLLCLDRNAGPAEARNRAIDIASADVLAILDADDRFLPGRLAPLVEREDWDLVADNVVFVNDSDFALPRSLIESERTPAFRSVSLAEFARGNLARSGVARGELGFLKPLISREFLLRNGLRYDPGLRLGEDYDLYVRALMAGARFLLTTRPGYVAQVRADSLSSRHQTQDLEALTRAMRTHLQAPGRTPDEIAALRQVLAQVEDRHAHRAVLDIKGQQGLPGVIRTLLARPGWITPVAIGVLRDKLQPQRNEAVREDFRLLLSEENLGSR